MHFLFFVLLATFSFSASAEERAAHIAGEKAQVIKLCANPETGEQIEYEAETAPPCPDGFSTYYDLTEAPIESIRNAPPPVKYGNGSEQETHDD